VQNNKQFFTNLVLLLLPVDTHTKMANFASNFILIVLIASLLPTAVMPGPAAYAACMATCMGFSGAVLTAFCALLCGPTLAAPTP
jgi:hypothetical protein